MLPILFVSTWKLRLGLFRLAVRSLWRSLYPLPLWLHFILFGSLVVVSMLGLLGLVKVLECWLTISYWSQ